MDIQTADIFEPRKAKRKNFYKWYRIIGIFTSVLLMAFLLTTNLNNDPPAAGEVSDPARIEPVWTDSGTFQVPVNVRIQTYKEDPEQRKDTYTASPAG